MSIDDPTPPIPPSPDPTSPDPTSPDPTSPAAPRGDGARAAGTLPATLLTIADFGDVRNLKTEESEAILAGLRAFDPEALLLCRDSRGHAHANTRRIVPFGALIPKLVNETCRRLGVRPRPVVKHLLDTFAARRIDEPCLLVTVPKGYPRTLRRNRELGGVNVCYEAFAASNYHWPDDTYSANVDPALALYDHFLLISSLARETYRRQGVSDERLHLVHMGVDVDTYRPAGGAGAGAVAPPDPETAPNTGAERPFRVLCMGNDPERKGFDLAIDAWQTLALPDAELHIVGNDIVDALGERAARAGPSVVLKGFSNAAAEMRSADLLLHPAVFEPFGKIVTEAMASGLPVVVSERTGAKDLVVEGVTGTVIPASAAEDTAATTTAIGEALRWHQAHRAESRAMGARAREHVAASYGWDDFSDRVSDALGKIVG